MRIFETYPTLDKLAIIRSADKENVVRFISDACISERGFAVGEEIISPDMSDIPVGFLLDGCATVGSADDGKHVLIRTVSAGAVFGVATLYSADQPFPTKICAKTPCRVLFIASSAMKALIENDHGANKEFLTFLGNRIVYLNKKINAFTAGSAERRLSLFLADNEADGVCSLDISMSALADMLDIGRASLYRALDTLTDEGFIERADKAIILKDKKAMLQKHFS
ncbi:MAG: Crp/Fnr family transcriptional regulator [Clostridia bacterium]|nr:Crp/Fnr family transcriptional regulator [Clostridia bacterium]